MYFRLKFETFFTIREKSVIHLFASKGIQTRDTPFPGQMFQSLIEDDVQKIALWQDEVV